MNVEKRGYHSEGDLVEVKPGMEKAVIKVARDVQSRLIPDESLNGLSQVKQVRITAQMLDVTDNLFEDLGFSWIYGANEKNYKNNAINVGIFEKGAIESMGVIYPLSVGFVKTFNSGEDILNLAINLLQATQDLVVSAIPTILVLDGHEGEFKITEEVIAGQSRVRYDEDDETMYTPIFKEAGTILKVKPIICGDGTIQMDLKVEVSNFKLRKSIKEETEEVNGGTFNENGGSKVSRSIETIVRIGDGETIFIGGLKRAVSQSGTSKVPMIGDVPLVGVFFKNQTVRSEGTDLFIKLRADIVGPYNTDDSGEEMSREIGRIYPKMK